MHTHAQVERTKCKAGGLQDKPRLESDTPRLESDTRESFYRQIHVVCLSVGGGICGVAMSSRLLKMIGLFCKRAPYNKLYSAKETYNFKEPTNGSHPICIHLSTVL